MGAIAMRNSPSAGRIMFQFQARASETGVLLPTIQLALRFSAVKI